MRVRVGGSDSPGNTQCGLATSRGGGAIAAGGGATAAAAVAAVGRFSCAGRDARSDASPPPCGDIRGGRRGGGRRPNVGRCHGRTRGADAPAGASRRRGRSRAAPSSDRGVDVAPAGVMATMPHHGVAATLGAPPTRRAAGRPGRARGHWCRGNGGGGGAVRCTFSSVPLSSRGALLRPSVGPVCRRALFRDARCCRGGQPYRRARCYDAPCVAPAADSRSRAPRDGPHRRGAAQRSRDSCRGRAGDPGPDAAGDRRGRGRRSRRPLGGGRPGGRHKRQRRGVIGGGCGGTGGGNRRQGWRRRRPLRWRWRWRRSVWAARLAGNRPAAQPRVEHW